MKLSSDDSVRYHTKIDDRLGGPYTVEGLESLVWILLIAGNTVLLGSAIAMQNTVSLVFGIGGSGLYTFGLLWSMYGVMNKY